MKIKNELEKVDPKKVQNLIEQKRAEEEAYEAMQNMFNEAEKEVVVIDNALQTLESIKKDLTAGKNLKELITRVNEIFEENIDDKNFKKLKDNLQLIAEKQDLGVVMKFIDDAIEFFKSFVGKDRITETTKAADSFTTQISKNEITPDKIKLSVSSSGMTHGAA